MLGALLGQVLDRHLHLQSLAHLREKLGGRPVLRNDELLFVLLGRLAKCDGRVVEGHIQQARAEMRALEMSESAQRRAIAAFNRGKSGSDRALAADYEPQHRPLVSSVTTYQDALRLLGVTATSEPAQIKRAYRRLLSRHHPDKIAGSGATASQVREATDKTRELHNAYTLIRQRRDFR
eukprot:gene4815-4715_t